jgi:hypothetical protein
MKANPPTPEGSERMRIMTRLSISVDGYVSERSLPGDSVESSTPATDDEGE